MLVIALSLLTYQLSVEAAHDPSGKWSTQLGSMLEQISVWNGGFKNEKLCGTVYTHNLGKIGKIPLNACM